ncbi:uncharacterized protein LOC116195406 [Punica granatum]|uniref:Uncharacterized protein n=2 Tax=Punica granatum TaxID=22663 RepID=A0A218X2I5_PUNGR|nr:uncharacterized protein LOC116195406 [Punica granatum]OWM79018.1 hypothetical protein CDL15_Pgr003189 [Punica granatum]PKI42956.1 hypothetical protein CRG98_036754 [Punica granatum]
MTRQIVLRGASSVSRRQPLLKAKSTSSSCSSVRFAEVAGGTTAECAAIWCCCPCGIMNLIVLAVYKVPAGLCRRALRRKRRQRLIKQGLLSPKGSRLSSRFEEREDALVHPITLSDLLEANKSAREVEMEVAQLEKEMWERFYGTGFWRSPSQREQNYSIGSN